MKRSRALQSDSRLLTAIPFLLSALVLTVRDTHGFRLLGPPTIQHHDNRHCCFLSNNIPRRQQQQSTTTACFAKFTNNSNKKKKELRPGSLEAATVELGRVPYGESSRKYRRTVYSHKDWVVHRSNDRLFTNLKGIFFSGIIRQLQKEVSVVTAVATFCVVWNDVCVPRVVVDLPHLVLPLLPFTLSSPALGLLLVFRTNASYQRWLEARMCWGIIEAQCRNMVRMALTFCATENDNNDSTQDRYRSSSMYDLARVSWLVARCIMNQLAGSDDDDAALEAEVREVYINEDPAFVTDLLSSPHRGLSALMEASLVLDRIPVDEKRRVEIDKSLVLLGDALAACERIFKSPVPLVYTRHTSRFLSLWMITLPFAIHDEFLKLEQTGLPTIPAAAILALFLFGVEELSVQLEEPFSILPMQSMCNDIQSQTRHLVEWTTTSRKKRLAG
eukprot:scaffold46464_cov199-Amphora_coffeaeformis.AAC.3